jgi:hypothetical protein
LIYNKRQILHHGVPPDSDHHDVTSFSPFHYYSVREDFGKGQYYLHGSTLSIPIIPILYCRQNHGFYTENSFLFTMIRHSSTEDGLRKLELWPIAGYEKYKNIYFYPFFYKNLEIETPTSGETSLPFLLYYHKWGLTSETLFAGPVIYREVKSEDLKFRAVAPVYFDYKDEYKSWDLIFPLRFQYKDAGGNFDLNILGFISKQNTGVVKPEISIGKKDGKWYLDTDLTFFYYLFTISSRITAANPFSKINEYTSELKENSDVSGDDGNGKEETKPKLTYKKDFSREDSINFFGWDALFKLIAYEKADTKRHIRAIPLSWLSWDQSSDDKVYVFPLPVPMVFFKSEDLQYNVVFPFYGQQSDANSEKKAFLINFYINEKYKDRKLEETSILWPFINFYQSNKKAGSRFIPFYFYKEKIESNYYEKKFYSLLLFKSNSITYDGPLRVKGEESTTLFWPYPTYYSTNKTGSITESTFFTIPFYRSKYNDRTFTNILLLWNWETVSDKLSYYMLFPFYYQPGNDRYFHVMPFYFSNSYESKESKTTDNSFFFFGYYQNIRKEVNYNSFNNNFFYFLYRYNHEARENNFTDTSLFLLGYYQNSVKDLNRNSFNNRFFYYLYQYQSEQNSIRNIRVLWLGYQNENNYSGDTDKYGTKTYNLFPLVWHERNLYSSTDYATDKKSDVLATAWVFGPFLGYSTRKENYSLDWALFGALYWNKKETEESTKHILLGTLYFESEKKERGYHSYGSMWGWLWEYQTEEESDYYKFSIIKIFSVSKYKGKTKIMGIEL